MWFNKRQREVQWIYVLWLLGNRQKCDEISMIMKDFIRGRMRADTSETEERGFESGKGDESKNILRDITNLDFFSWMGLIFQSFYSTKFHFYVSSEGNLRLWRKQDIFSSLLEKKNTRAYYPHRMFILFLLASSYIWSNVYESGCFVLENDQTFTRIRRKL